MQAEEFVDMISSIRFKDHRLLHHHSHHHNHHNLLLPHRPVLVLVLLYIFLRSYDAADLHTLFSHISMFFD